MLRVVGTQFVVGRHGAQSIGNSTSRVIAAAVPNHFSPVRSLHNSVSSWQTSPTLAALSSPPSLVPSLDEIEPPTNAPHHHHHHHALYAPTALAVMALGTRGMSMMAARTTATRRLDDTPVASSTVGGSSSSSSSSQGRSSPNRAASTKSDVVADVAGVAAVPLDRQISDASRKRSVNAVRRQLVRRGDSPPRVVTPSKKAAAVEAVAEPASARRRTAAAAVVKQAKPAAAVASARSTLVVAAATPRSQASIVEAKPAARRSGRASARPAALPFTVRDDNVVIIRDVDGPLHMALLSHASLASIPSLYQPEPAISLTTLAMSLPSLRVDARLSGDDVPASHKLLLQVVEKAHAQLFTVAQRMLNVGRIDFDSLPLVFAPGTAVQVPVPSLYDDDDGDHPRDNGMPQWMAATVKSSRFAFANEFVPDDVEGGEHVVMINDEAKQRDMDSDQDSDNDDNDVGHGFFVEIEQVTLVRGTDARTGQYHSSAFGTCTRTIYIAPFSGVMAMNNLPLRPLAMRDEGAATPPVRPEHMAAMATQFAAAWASAAPTAVSSRDARQMRWNHIGLCQDVMVVPASRRIPSSISTTLVANDAWRFVPYLDVFILSEARWAQAPIHQLSPIAAQAPSSSSSLLSLPIRSLTIPTASSLPHIAPAFASLLTTQAPSSSSSTSSFAIITGVSGMGKRSFVRSLARQHGRPVMTLSTDDRTWASKLTDASQLGAVTLLHTRSSAVFRPQVYQSILAALDKHVGPAVIMVVDCDRLIPGDDTHVPDVLATRAAIDLHINMLDSGMMRTLLAQLVDNGVATSAHTVPPFEQAVPLSLFLAALRAQTLVVAAASSASPASASSSSSSTNESTADDASTTTSGDTTSGGSTSSVGGPIVWMRSPLL